MHKYFLSFVLLCSLSFLSADNISVMSINAQNLFDTVDDPGKDDKAFLPIELKQSMKHKNACNSINVKDGEWSVSFKIGMKKLRMQN